ncbi:MAG: DUF1449 family protein [Calditrichaeota bacterium]|nr:MAG: DUF1449 family protein [Calditrichota bacterium]
MITLYLCCLAFGGILLIVSLFTGSDGELAGDVEIEADVGTEAESEGVVNAFRYFSFRNIVYFLTFFGLTGVTVARIELPSVVTFVAALVMGFFAASLGHVVMEYLKNSQVGQAENLADFEGQLAKVLLNISELKPGKISITLDENIHQVLARVADESAIQEFRHGETVTVVRVQDGYAYVAEKNFID